MTKWKNRIVGHGEEAPDQLLANPNNWRIHPGFQQEALAAVLDEVGWVQEVIVNRTTGHLIDGHLRVQLAMRRDESMIPVKYVELSEAEEQTILAMLDPIGAMAAADREKLDELLSAVQSSNEQVRQALERTAVKEGILPPIDYDEAWRGMPEFKQEDHAPYRTLLIHFDSQKAVDDFAGLIEQKITGQTRYVWYPKKERVDLLAEACLDES